MVPPPVTYGDVMTQPGVSTWSGVPGGTTGWQVVSVMPASRFGAATYRLCVMVQGIMGNIRITGPGASAGTIEVCLGIRQPGGALIDNGWHIQRIQVLETLGAGEGVPFQLMLAQTQHHGGLTDPTFGSTWNFPTNGDIVLLARAARLTDPGTYTVTFDVGDVAWIWWFMSSIPSGDQMVSEVIATGLGTPTNFPTTPTGVLLATQPGVAGTKWLHFMSVSYGTRSPGTMLAPRIQIGHSTTNDYTGFAVDIGSHGKWGQARGVPGAGATRTRITQGAFWYTSIPAGIYRPALIHSDRQTLALPSQLYRAVYVGIRLDALSDLLVRTDTSLPALTSNLFTAPLYPNNSIVKERVATGFVSNPIAMTHGIVATTGRQSYGAALTTNANRVLDPLDLVAINDAALLEGVSIGTLAAEGISSNALDVQYRSHFVGGANAPPVAQEVRDFTFIQFVPIKDFHPIRTQPPTPTYSVLTPGREGPDVSALLDLPVLPDGVVDQDASLHRASIDGATGYSRTWPLWSKVARSWTIVWSYVTSAQAHSLLTFFDANPIFRWAPPGQDGKVAVVQMDVPTIEQTSGQVHAARANVGELIWTGP